MSCSSLNRFHPHPDPLPEGEGKTTRSFACGSEMTTMVWSAPSFCQRITEYIQECRKGVLPQCWSNFYVIFLAL